MKSEAGRSKWSSGEIPNDRHMLLSSTYCKLTAQFADRVGDRGFSDGSADLSRNGIQNAGSAAAKQPEAIGRHSATTAALGPGGPSHSSNAPTNIGRSFVIEGGASFYSPPNSAGMVRYVVGRRIESCKFLPIAELNATAG